MSREVNGIQEALEVLKKLNVAWSKVNNIQNSLWDTGVAFFGKDHNRVAYFDEMQDILLIS